MRAKLWLMAAAVVTVLQLATVTAAAAVDGVNSVEQLLRKLSVTLQEQDYRGLFTYEHGGNLETLEVIHVVQDGVEYERLQHLSGPARQVVREGRRTDCVNTAAHLLRGSLFRPGSDASQHLHQYYDFQLAGRERVANRTATVVRLTPKDPYRYGFSLSVDKASGFPVKTLIVDANQQVLERLQFVELELNATLDQLSAQPAQTDRLAVSGSPEDCALVRQDEPPSPDAAEWQARWLPQGFVLSEQSYSEADGHQLTYTDGLASFSVFIQSAGRDAPQPTLAQRGATVALMLPLRDAQALVTVVGEVPPVTAEQVALGVQRAAPGRGER